MSTSDDDAFDERLAARFRREPMHIEPQPFVRLTLERVATERARVALFRRVLRVLALIAVMVTSPWLIAASGYASGALDKFFDFLSGWLSTPAGMVGSALVVIVTAALYRWHLWRARA